jgi:hypothetical protein
MLTFIEHPAFTRRIIEMDAEEALRSLQAGLAANPDAGDPIRGLAGLRKIRMALPGRGKRGGARVLYLLFVREEAVYFVQVYDKADIEDLPPDKRRIVATLVKEIAKEFAP